MEPAALRKAKALEQHLSGLSKEGAFVTLTDPEAWELLDWLTETLPPESQDEYVFDLSAAKLKGTPWEMLDSSFQLYGFSIQRVADLH